jgi:pimeloyl-ACP methyl ester carboxylesterase
VTRSLFLVIMLFLAGCAGPSQFISHAFPGKVPDGINLQDPDKRILLIFNHGSEQERSWDICRPTSWTVPEVIQELSGQKVNGRDIVVYNFCSTSPGEYDAKTRSGEPKVLKRAQGIEAVVRAFEEEGVPPRQVFLVGHSAGGWASLLVARRHYVKFNAVIAFGPAFAGTRADRSPGWQALRQRLASMIAEADHINGLVYAYANDPYESAADLAFLGRIDGVHLIPIDARFDGAGGRCPGPYGHRTAFRSCFARSQEQIILGYIRSQLAAP